MSTIITRYAPSPTGHLHIGNVRTAIIAWLFARSTGGKFILRIDDTDAERSHEKYVDSIKRDLEWLGLFWDDTFKQSSRAEHYDHIKNELIKSGRLYPCYETEEELAIKKKIALNTGKPPIYDRNALKLTKEEHLAIQSSGIKPHYRFKMLHEEIIWDDLVKGHVVFDGRHISDPVWVRSDGTMTYSIASVIDDIDYNINTIVRGEDHITNSATHKQLFEALGANAPNFAHTSLLQSKTGKISKRIGGFEISSLREMGVEPITILNFLAKVGTSDSPEIDFEVDHLISTFDIKKLNKAAIYYTPDELIKFNAKMIHKMPYSIACDKLDTGIDEIFWDTIKYNVNTVRDANAWYHIAHGEVLIQEVSTEELQVIDTACDTLPPGDIDSTTWHKWTATIKERTGISGKNLFMALRKALTGLDSGPDLAQLLPLIDRNLILERLNKYSNK